MKYFGNENNKKNLAKIISVLLCVFILLTGAVSISSSAAGENCDRSVIGRIIPSYRSFFEKIISFFTKNTIVQNEDTDNNDSHAAKEDCLTEKKEENKEKPKEEIQKEDTVKDDIIKNEPAKDETNKDESATDETDNKNHNNTENDAVSDKRSEFENEVVKLVNKIRKSYNLNELKINQTLVELSRQKSQDMHDKHYFAHQSPTYGSAFDMMKKAGVSYRNAGENIAMGYSNPSAVVDAWMNSEGHRANILSDKYTQIGIGYVEDGNYWTQMFIG